MISLVTISGHFPVLFAFFPDVPLHCHSLSLCTAASILPSSLTLWGFVTILPDFSASLLHTPLRGLFLWIIDHLLPPPPHPIVFYYRDLYYLFDRTAPDEHYCPSACWATWILRCSFVHRKLWVDPVIPTLPPGSQVPSNTVSKA